MKLWLCDACVKNMNKRKKVWESVAGRFALGQRGQCAQCDKQTKVKSYDDSQGK